ncbi:MAG: hypothetical protein ACOCY7_04660 [Halodesulfurarchaeum sp.]
MRERHSTGRYHEWKSFLRCPDCNRTTIALDHYADGTLFRCEDCGAEAWAEGISESDPANHGR